MALATKTVVKNLVHRCVSQEVFASEETRSPPYTKSSSTTKGIEIAKSNGNPSITPKSKNKVAANVRLLFLRVAGSSVYENAKAVVYIVNDDGRNASGTFSKRILELELDLTCRGIPHSSIEEHHEEQITANSIINF